MSRKQDVQKRIMRVQKLYGALSAELKQIQADEKLARDMERFKEYKFKVILTEKGLTEDVSDLLEKDYGDCFFDADSLAYLKYPTSKTKDYLLLKSQDDLPRMKRLFEVRWATHYLREGVQPEKQIAVILGENNAKKPRLRRTLKEINAELKVLDEQSMEIYRAREKLSAEKEAVRLHNAKVGDVLKEAVWSLDISNCLFRRDLKDSSMRMGNVSLCGDNDEFKKLSNLLEDNYHCQHNFEKGVNLRFDDGTITLSFEDVAPMLSFANKYELPISMQHIDKQIKEHTDKAAQLQEVIDYIRKGLLRGDTTDADQGSPQQG